MIPHQSTQSLQYVSSIYLIPTFIFPQSLSSFLSKAVSNEKDLTFHPLLPVLKQPIEICAAAFLQYSLECAFVGWINTLKQKESDDLAFLDDFVNNSLCRVVRVLYSVLPLSGLLLNYTPSVIAYLAQMLAGLHHMFCIIS